MLQADYDEINNEELRILKRTVQSEVFHFIIVQYNHFSLIQKTKEFLSQNFPHLAQKRFELTENEAYNFMPELLDCTGGVVFIERAEYLFTEQYKSICIGLNQRRDRYSMLPIQIITFLPIEIENIRFFRKCLPDVFSIVSPMLQLKKAIVQQHSSQNISFENAGYYPNATEAQNDIVRITERLKSLEKTKENKALIVKLYFTLEKAYSTLGNYSKALATLKEIEPEICEDDKINEAVFNNNLGQIYKALGDFEQSKQHAEKALSIDLKNFGENQPVLAVKYSNLGQIYQALGDFEQSKQYAEKALAIDLKNFDENHPSLAVKYSNLGLTYQALGDLEQAKQYTEKALGIVLKNFGENHPTIAIYYSNLGQIFKALGDLDQAKQFTEKSISIDLKSFGENHPQVAIYYSNLGQIYQAFGDLEQAVQYTKKALTIDLKNFGENHPNVAIYYSNLGAIYQALGDIEQAKQYAEKALRIFEKSYGIQHPNYKTVSENLEIINSLK